MYGTGQHRSKILAHMQAETMVRKELNTACHNSKQKELNTVPGYCYLWRYIPAKIQV